MNPSRHSILSERRLWQVCLVMSEFATALMLLSQRTSDSNGRTAATGASGECPLWAVLTSDQAFRRPDAALHPRSAWSPFIRCWDWHERRRHGPSAAKLPKPVPNLSAALAPSFHHLADILKAKGIQDDQIDKHDH